jgi:hypothetical protein
MGWFELPIPRTACAVVAAAAAAAWLANLTKRNLHTRAVNGLHRSAKCISYFKLPLPPLLVKEPARTATSTRQTVIFLRLDTHRQGSALSPGQQAEYEAAAHQALAALWSRDPSVPRMVGIDCEWQPERRSGEHNRWVDAWRRLISCYSGAHYPVQHPVLVTVASH